MDETAAPYIPPNPFGVKQAYWERIQNLRLMDDMLMSAALDNNLEATQLILRILLEKEDLIITSAKAQTEYKNLYGHSIRLDVEATDSRNDLIDIEVQRADEGAGPERARYNSAMMDAHSLKSGQKPRELPETYVVFITENDVYREGLPLYHFDRVMRETGRMFGDRAHILYVNGAYRGEDPVGRLMADFRTGNPDEMNFPELAGRIRALKTSENEVRKMCRAMEITYEEGRVEGRMEGRVEGRVEGRMEGYARSIRSLMRRQGLSDSEAMDVLEIPVEERPACRAYLEEQDG